MEININQLSLLFIVGIMNIFSGKIAKNMGEKKLKNLQQSLPDIFHNNIPNINYYIPDIIIFPIGLIALIKIISIGCDNIEINMISLIYSMLLRSIVVPMTIMPSTRNKVTNENIYEKLFLSSHDFMFSGHTIFYIFFGKIIEECYQYNMICFIMGRFIQFFIPILSIISRQHYTIDVIMSMVVYRYFYYYQIYNMLN